MSLHIDIKRTKNKKPWIFLERNDQIAHSIVLHIAKIYTLDELRTSALNIVVGNMSIVLAYQTPEKLNQFFLGFEWVREAILHWKEDNETCFWIALSPEIDVLYHNQPWHILNGRKL